MTREEAVKTLQELLRETNDSWYEETYKMAIEALEQEPSTYCKDCKHWHEWENGTGSCHRSNIMWVGSDYDDYCSFAEPKGSDKE